MEPEDYFSFGDHTATKIYYGASLSRPATGSGLSLKFPQPFTPEQAREYCDTHYSGWDVDYYL